MRASFSTAPFMSWSTTPMAISSCNRRSMSKDTFPVAGIPPAAAMSMRARNYLVAARRELGEELGIEGAPLPLRPLLKLPAVPETGHEFIQIFLLGPLPGPFDLNPEEITEGSLDRPSELDILIREKAGPFRRGLAPALVAASRGDSRCDQVTREVDLCERTALKKLRHPERRRGVAHGNSLSAKPLLPAQQRAGVEGPAWPPRGHAAHRKMLSRKSGGLALLELARIRSDHRR